MTTVNIDVTAHGVVAGQSNCTQGIARKRVITNNQVSNPIGAKGRREVHAEGIAGLRQNRYVSRSSEEVRCVIKVKLIH